MMRSYDYWKTATPPEYEESGPDPIDELLESVEDMTLEQVGSALSEIEWQYPRLADKVADVRLSLGL